MGRETNKNNGSSDFNSFIPVIRCTDPATGDRKAMKAMIYQGYVANIEYDTEDRIFVDHLADIRDTVGFHGTSLDELESAFHEAVDHYLAVCEKIGQKPQLNTHGSKL
ncbi:MAG: hypothetical protein VSS75_018300 [Candidatus Parabeggiatoa sp.]|nr:hypothetical protein [Candidatus Parabeggiatoa sp.]